MSTVCVYSYADASGNTSYVDENDYNYTGTWSSTGTYVAITLDTVTYATALYICTRNNIGDNPRRTPTRLNPSKWSILSLLYEYQCDGTTPTSTADAAYALAESGTNIAWAAYALAQAGTNTGTAAYNLAQEALVSSNGANAIAIEALQTAWNGTSAASNALDLAGSAFSIAVDGTNAANSALDILSSGLSGTHSVWASTIEGGPANLQLIFIDGLLNSIVPV